MNFIGETQQGMAKRGKEMSWIVARLPPQQEKIHAHSFVLGPELWIQYTYTLVQNSENHRFWVRCTYRTNSSRNRCEYTYVLMNSNSIRIHIRQDIARNSKCMYSRWDGNDDNLWCFLSKDLERALKRQKLSYRVAKYRKLSCLFLSSQSVTRAGVLCS